MDGTKSRDMWEYQARQGRESGDGLGLDNASFGELPEICLSLFLPSLPALELEIKSQGAPLK